MTISPHLNLVSLPALSTAQANAVEEQKQKLFYFSILYYLLHYILRVSQTWKAENTILLS